MRRPFPVVLLALVFSPASGALAQTAQPGQVTRPTPQQTPARAPGPNDRIVGKSVLRGFVVLADTGAPVRRAMVSAVADPQRRGSTVTDAEGRFEINELPAGRYRVTAMKSGLLAPGMEKAGASMSAGPRPTIEIGEAQVVEKYMVPMLRGGVISGRITDEFGEAVAGVQVSAMRYAFREGKRQLTPAMSPGSGPFSQTDDLGGFRIYGLPAGEYFVSARPPREPMFGVENVPPEGMAMTFFPGSPDVAQARPVQVRAGHEVPNVAFALTRLRLSRVRGTVLTSRGEPYVGANVMVSGADAMMMGGFTTGGGNTGADGSFTINGLSPGAYNLTARSGFGMGDDVEMGTTRIVADGGDIDGVVIAASRGGTLQGRVVTDDGSPLPRTTGLMVMAMSVERGLPMMGPSQGTVKDDGTFEIKGLFGPRQVRFSFQGAPLDGWGFKGTYVGSDDVTDEGIDFGSGRVVEGVEVVLTRKLTRLSGAVTGPDGRPATTGMVLIFPADERRWGQMSRYVRFMPITAESRFEIRGVPPYDDYRIIAIPPIEDGLWTDPEFLRGLLDTSTRLSLAEGDTKTQDLRLVRLDR